MNKYLKFSILVIATTIFVIFTSTSRQWGVADVVLLVGVLSNMLAVSSNRLKMPIYLKETKKKIDREHSFITSEKKKIRLFYLCDIIRIPKTYIFLSVGDLLLFAGFLIFILWGL